MKPGGKPRAYSDWEPITPMGGTGVLSSIGEGEAGAVAAVLWIPDPEQRHGWREFYVRRDPPRPSRVGFRSPKVVARRAGR